MHILSFCSAHITMYFNDQKLSIGTAFFAKNNHSIYLITNWHNVTGRHFETGKCLSINGGIPNKITIRYWQEISDQKIKIVKITVPLYDKNNDPNQDSPLWIEKNKDADIVALKLDNSKIKPLAYPQDFSGDIAIDPGSDVYIIGYPNNINIQGTPIWKKASIASEPSLNAHQDKKNFLVDSATREGMSGSPVFATSHAHSTKGGGYAISNSPSILFVGIYSGRLGTTDQLDAQLGIVWRTKNIDNLLPPEPK